MVAVMHALPRTGNLIHSGCIFCPALGANLNHPAISCWSQEGISVWLKTFHVFYLHHGGKCVCCSCSHICSMYFAHLKRLHAELFAVLCSSLGGKVFPMKPTHGISFQTFASFRFEANLSIKFDQSTAGVVSNSAPPKKTTGERGCTIRPSFGTPRQRRYFVRPNDFHPTAWARI